MRFIGFALVASLIIAPCASLHADSWPTRTVRIVTPQPAGSGIDLAARLFSDRLSKRWGQPAFVENRPGADGIAGVSNFVNTHDDHTLLFSFGSPITISPLMSETKLPYDPKADLVPIGSVVDIILAIGVSTTSDVQSLPELARAARAHPGQFNWGATAGLPQFVFAGYLKGSDLQMTEVPYKEVPPALVDLTAGRIQYYVTSYAILRAVVESRQARLVAILNRARAPMMPDVPTIAELGHPELAVDSFAGFFGGRDMAPERRAQIAADIRAVGAEPDVAAQLAKFGMVLKVTDPAAFAGMIDRQAETVKTIVKAVGH